MNFVTKEPINKGWSKDKKYCVTDENGNRYLLRVSDIAEYDVPKRATILLNATLTNWNTPFSIPFGMAIFKICFIKSPFHWKIHLQR